MSTQPEHCSFPPMVLFFQQGLYVSILNKAKKGEAAKAVDDGHKYCISAPEDILTNLQPDSEGITRPAEIPDVSVALTVEDVVAENSTPAPKSKPNQTETTLYELQEHNMDHVLTVFTFFKDINDIWDHFMNVGRDYRNRKLETMSAAVMTDTAFGIMRRSSTSSSGHYLWNRTS
ncbi:hypothetical protein DOTSEDRAFT_54236 [Dothistroma septosporum NZE10]|uniref:DUF6604 domain-containing protein n=1 Tax=Dothistroma septosporum (strain NZE10 / CBS 128990) TaxID=675120 RepID=M2WN21_DOTSN|nr:hypothetical protein DOTSEDRAFT_54236 [Dothistroma septosporum NZE10]